MADLLGLDLKGFAEAGVSIQLKNPITNELLDSFISIKGADSADYKNAMIAAARSRSGADTPDHDLEGAKMLALITTGWKGLNLGDDEIEFSIEEAEKLYLRFGWISDQVFIAVNDRKLFLVNAKTN